MYSIVCITTYKKCAFTSPHLADFSSGLEGGLAEVAIEVLHLFLSHLRESQEDEVGVN